MTNESKTSSSAIDSYPLCLLHSSIIPTEHRPSNSQLQLRETKTIATRRDQTKTIPSQARITALLRQLRTQLPCEPWWTVPLHRTSRVSLPARACVSRCFARERGAPQCDLDTHAL